jgi:hypothetical protein
MVYDLCRRMRAKSLLVVTSRKNSINRLPIQTLSVVTKIVSVFLFEMSKIKINAFSSEYNTNFLILHLFGEASLL